jgi:hypothetical protein
MNRVVSTSRTLPSFIATAISPWFDGNIIPTRGSLNIVVHKLTTVELSENLAAPALGDQPWTTATAEFDPTVITTNPA